MQHKVFLFDVDGVIVNSHQFQAQALRESFQKHIEAAHLDILAPSRQALLDILVGGTEETAIPAIHKLLPQLSSQMAVVIADAWKYFYEAMSEQSEQFAIENTISILRDLHLNGYIIRLVSNSKRADICRYCRALDLQFILDEDEKYIISRESTSKPKPSPEVYLRACAAAMAKPADCIVFEDSYVGIQAGKAAGMYVVALLSEYSEESKLRDSGADEVVHTLSQAQILQHYITESTLISQP